MIGGFIAPAFVTSVLLGMGGNGLAVGATRVATRSADMVSVNHGQENVRFGLVISTSLPGSNPSQPLVTQPVKITTQAPKLAIARSFRLALFPVAL